MTEGVLPLAVSFCSVVHFERPVSTADGRVTTTFQQMTKQQIKNYEVTLSLEMFSAKTSRDVHRNGAPDQVAARENQPVEKYRSKEGYAMTF